MFIIFTKNNYLAVNLPMLRAPVEIERANFDSDKIVCFINFVKCS